MATHTLRSVILLAPFVFATGAIAQEAPWTLERAVERALTVAPELAEAQAEVGARTGDVTSAEAWPNPTVEMRADEKLGMQDGRGGVAFTQFAVTQPLAFRRRPAERRAAEAALSASEAARGNQQLRIEREAAHDFHRLQLATTRLRLAQEKLALAGDLEKRRDQLVRYLTPLERARLSLLQEQARQELNDFTAQASEAEKRFASRLALPLQSAPVTSTLSAPDAPRSIGDLEAMLATHPEIVAAQREIDAARAGIDAARARRLADPSLTLFQERDSFNGEHRSFSGIMLGVQVPLWNRNQGPVQRARADAEGAQARFARIEREAAVRLLESHNRLARLRTQAQQQQEQMVASAEKLLAMSRRSFGAGEINALALIDAYNAYFAARERHATLLAEAAEASADLRLAMGESLVNAP